MIRPVLYFSALVLLGLAFGQDVSKEDQSATHEHEISLPGSELRVRPRRDVRAPILEIVFPGGQESPTDVWIELPESVLARIAGEEEELELYGNHHAENEPPKWSVAGGTIEYAMEMAENCSLGLNPASADRPSVS